ncbi:uncharacterized protein LOC143062600 [Mytilus galloprovincialis]|uniref:uncharacterized protein LOC143062600 n=1 Tax=Mytilus galloprovincialis TaxID=29158 RepID=UPI003F7C0772
MYFTMHILLHIVLFVHFVHAKPGKPGCVYEGKHYKVGEKINDYGNYGLQCGKWGITAWENYQDDSKNQKTTKLSTSSTEPTTPKVEREKTYKPNCASTNELSKGFKE